MKDKILIKVDELVEILQQEEEYQQFLILEDKLKKDHDFSKLMEEVKSIQRKLVNDEYRNVDTKVTEEKYQAMLRKMNLHPVYIDYLNIKDSLDLKYQLIIKQIEKVIK